MKNVHFPTISLMVYSIFLIVVILYFIITTDITEINLISIIFTIISTIILVISLFFFNWMCIYIYYGCTKKRPITFVHNGQKYKFSRFENDEHHPLIVKKIVQSFECFWDKFGGKCKCEAPENFDDYIEVDRI